MCWFPCGWFPWWEWQYSLCFCWCSVNFSTTPKKVLIIEHCLSISQREKWHLYFGKYKQIFPGLLPLTEPIKVFRGDSAADVFLVWRAWSHFMAATIKQKLSLPFLFSFPFSKIETQLRAEATWAPLHSVTISQQRQGIEYFLRYKPSPTEWSIVMSWLSLVFLSCSHIVVTRHAEMAWFFIWVEGEPPLNLQREENHYELQS